MGIEDLRIEDLRIEDLGIEDLGIEDPFAAVPNMSELNGARSLLPQNVYFREICDVIAAKGPRQAAATSGIHSALMFAALIIGHHFSMSAF